MTSTPPSSTANTPKSSATPASTSSTREFCYRCHKPEVLCLCARITPVDNRTEVLVLQHPRERHHAIGTARFARLGLLRARVEVAWNAGLREEDPPAFLPEGAALLYPGPGARDLNELAPHELPKSLVVIDGTWHTARTLYRDKAWLQKLPHYRFSPLTPSRYRLRREPQADYVSTIEAIVAALELLEPETRGLPALLEAFDSMIDQQLGYIERRSGDKRQRAKRPAEQRRVPHVLVDELSRVVMLYAESFRVDMKGPRELVQVTAQSLRNDACFERMMQLPSGEPGDRLLKYLQLTAADFTDALGAGELATLGQELGAFLASTGPQPVIAIWNQATLDMLHGILPEGPAPLQLKSAYRSVYGADGAGLDQVVTRHGLTLQPNAVRGRASRRLGSAVAIARLLHARATTETAQLAADNATTSAVAP